MASQAPALAGYDDQTSARSGPYSFPDSEALSSHGSVACNNTLELASATTRWLSNPFFNEQCHSFDESRPGSVQGRCHLKSHQLDNEPSAPSELPGNEQPSVHKASQLVQAAKAGKLHLVWASQSSSSFRHSVQPSPTARGQEDSILSQYSAASSSESGKPQPISNKFRSMSLVKNLVENYERQGSLKRSPAPTSVSTYPEAEHVSDAYDSFTGLSKEYSLPQDFLNEAAERDKDASADHSFNPLFGERADRPIVMQLSTLRSANKQEVDQLNLTIQMLSDDDLETPATPCPEPTALERSHSSSVTLTLPEGDSSLRDDVSLSTMDLISHLYPTCHSNTTCQSNPDAKPDTYFQSFTCTARIQPTSNNSYAHGMEFHHKRLAPCSSVPAFNLDLLNSEEGLSDETFSNPDPAIHDHASVDDHVSVNDHTSDEPEHDVPYHTKQGPTIRRRRKKVEALPWVLMLGLSMLPLVHNHIQGGI